MSSDGVSIVTALAPVAIAAFSVIGAWIGLKHAEAKRKAELSEASAPSGVAVVAGGMLAERAIAEAHTAALLKLSDAILSAAQVIENGQTSERRSRQHERIVEELIEARRSLDEIARNIHRRSPHGE